MRDITHLNREILARDEARARLQRVGMAEEPLPTPTDLRRRRDLQARIIEIRRRERATGHTWPLDAA